MKLNKTEANIILLALIALILMLAVIMSGNLIHLENLELNRHVLEDCKIDPSELDLEELPPDAFSSL